MLTEANIDTPEIDPASFRDPSGFILQHARGIYRAIAPSYFKNYDLLENSGLYVSLNKKKWLIPHVLADYNFLPEKFHSYKIIKPEKIPFISYPYEWGFSQLKNAALLTLKIQKESLRHGMSLKDASAYNVQFKGSEPVFIDTLSFEKYIEGNPWVAYGQFCRHFLAPLALMAYRHSHLLKLSQTYIDGIPLELADTLLPRRSLANSAVLSHLHIHAKFQRAQSLQQKQKNSSVAISKKRMFTILEHMQEGIEGFSLKDKKSTWNKYENIHNYTLEGKRIKETIIANWLEKIKPKSVWDMGCNTGEYSLLAAQYSSYVLAMDNDHLCIEALYENVSKKSIKNILPLVVDLSNPSPGIGWNNQERQTLPERGKGDLLLALALVHHLRIGNNIPWKYISGLFSKWGNNLIIEFIPKEDSQIIRMIGEREDVFHDINFECFQNAFDEHFNFEEIQIIPNSSRILCLLKKK